jgi:hypothetical protein
MERSTRRKNPPPLFLIGLALVAGSTALATEPWHQPLSTMPLPTGIPELNRSNCVQMMLAAFQSNNVVKGLIFMPGATDEFYFFKRATAKLKTPTPSLLDAVNALNAQTRIQATFRTPLLLLHTQEDLLQPLIEAQNETVAQKIKATAFVPHAFYYDADWDFLQPILRKTLKADIFPAYQSSDSWHFYRHSFAAWNLDGWEALEAVALAGKTRCRIEKQGGLSFRRIAVFFEPDKRVLRILKS